jgi:hypothetical protein
VVRIDRVKRRRGLPWMPMGWPDAWYYRIPWVLIAAAVTLLLVYMIALFGIVGLLYRHLIEAPVERLVARRR